MMLRWMFGPSRFSKCGSCLRKAARDLNRWLVEKSSLACQFCCSDNKLFDFLSASDCPSSIRGSFMPVSLSGHRVKGSTVVLTPKKIRYAKHWEILEVPQKPSLVLVVVWMRHTMVARHQHGGHPNKTKHNYRRSAASDLIDLVA